MRQPPERRAEETAELAAKLKSWREAADLSQSRAAAMLGVPRRTYEGWEVGRRMPYPRILMLALQAFDSA